jgi:hypothetical protein
VNWKGLLGSIAPTFATALGGPVAGMAVKALSKTLLGHEEGSEADIELAMAEASPDTLLKIKEADNAFKLEMQRANIDLEKIAADDRANARTREIATKDNAPKILATVIVIGFFATLYTIAFISLPEGAQQPVNILLGALTAMLTQVGNYYFGSSAGSKAKTDLLGAKK